jgi:ABC-type multidrug transport system fused ATPase/permease subunit
MLAYSATGGEIRFLVEGIFDDVFQREDAHSYLPIVIVFVLAFLGMMNFGEQYLTDFIGLRVVHNVRNAIQRHLRCRSLLYSVRLLRRGRWS